MGPECKPERTQSSAPTWQACFNQVLVVDDNPRIHDDFRKVLASSGVEPELRAAEAMLFGGSRTVPQTATYSVDAVLHGEEAVQLARGALERGGYYAVAFIDIRMPPGWDGLRTAEELWKVDPGLQIVFCTAYSDYTWEEILERVGMRSDFLIIKKPFDTVEVRQAVCALSEKRRLSEENRRTLIALETKVQERTQQLERANEHLQLQVNERLVLERGLQQTQKLEALGKLVAGIGHEINDPLAVIHSNLELAIGELMALTSRTPNERLSSICDDLAEAVLGVERIKRTVQSVRLYSRPWETAPTDVDLHDAIRAALVVLGSELRHRALVVHDFGDVPRVVGDAHRLEQVFVNLLMNALQALPMGDGITGKIRITTRTWDNGEVVTSVSDDGCGIPAGEIARVFEPFYSGDSEGRGSGLGLWVCKSIVEGLGGRIEVESIEGAGTVARVVLRRSVTDARTQALTLAPATRARPELSGARILVVDDEVPLLRSLQRTLVGFDTSVCRDGREALELYRREPYDLVLCDIMMPGLGGREFYDSLAAMGPEHSQRIVFVTAGVLTEGVREFLAKVQNPWLGKPFSVNALLDVVNRQLRRASQDLLCER